MAEGLPKCPGKKQKTLLYRRKKLNNAVIDWKDAHTLSAERKHWKMLEMKRMKHGNEWGRNQENAHAFSRLGPSFRDMKSSQQICSIAYLSHCENVQHLKVKWNW